jgi:uncharacterized protein YicC (UPF0701 family)
MGHFAIQSKKKMIEEQCTLHSVEHRLSSFVFRLPAPQTLLEKECKELLIQVIHVAF